MLHKLNDIHLSRGLHLMYMAIQGREELFYEPVGNETFTKASRMTDRLMTDSIKIFRFA